MKKAAAIIAFLVVAIPCFGAETGTHVPLREYIERLFVEQDRYISARFDAIDTTFKEKQRALEVGSSVLDAKFVKIDEFIKRTSAFDSAISTLGSRLTIMETNASAQDKQSEGAKGESAALVAKWGLGLGAFFTILQILIHVFINRGRRQVIG